MPRGEAGNPGRTIGDPEVEEGGRELRNQGFEEKGGVAHKPRVNNAAIGRQMISCLAIDLALARIHNGGGVGEWEDGRTFST